MLTLILATTNTGKQQEIQAFFAHAGLANIRVVLPSTLPDVDETGHTFAANAQLKAVETANQLSLEPNDTHTFVMAEDSGFTVPALSGKVDGFPFKDFPGVWSNRWLSDELQAKLLNGQTYESRQGALDSGIYALCKQYQIPLPTPAQYTSSLAVVKPGQTSPCFVAEGTMELVVVKENTPKGQYGFGYDGIVAPVGGLTAGNNRPTLSHWQTNEKTDISHRGQALQQLASFLKSTLTS